MARGPAEGRKNVEKRIIDFAEDLGALLGRAQEKAKSWLGQRDQVASSLTHIRDTAARLLDDIGMGAAEATRAARRGYRKGARATGGRVRTTGKAGTGTTPKRQFSAATRRKMAAAQRARWAKRKADQTKK